MTAVGLARLEMQLSQERVSCTNYVREAYNRWLIPERLNKLGQSRRIMEKNQPVVRQMIKTGAMGS